MLGVTILAPRNYGNKYTSQTLHESFLFWVATLATPLFGTHSALQHGKSGGTCGELKVSSKAREKIGLDLLTELY